MKYIGIALAVLFLLLLIWFVKTFNQFVTIRNRVKDQGAQIDVQLKRRFDLIPNLVETVKGCASFESETLDAVIKARTSALQSNSLQESAAADKELSGALHRLIAVSEGYPDLKASTNFAKLQQELSETEDKIAKSRQFYNDTILKYNNTIEVFPASLIAGITGFRRIEFLEVAESEKQPAKVSF